MFIVKNSCGTPVPNGVCARKPWSFSSACTNLSRQRPLEAEIWSSEKVDLGGSETACSAVLLVDQSSPDFFRRTREESLSITYLSDFGYLYPFRRYSRSNFEVVRNRPKFGTFLARNILGEGPRNFGTSIIKYKNLLITWQSFSAIGRRSSEIWR